jgi:hypothetical protein
MAESARAFFWPRRAAGFSAQAQVAAWARARHGAAPLGRAISQQSALGRGLARRRRGRLAGPRKKGARELLGRTDRESWAAADSFRALCTVDLLNQFCHFQKPFYYMYHTTFYLYNYCTNVYNSRE